MAKMSPVVHFEMGYNDKDRMVKFYETAFGWKAQPMGQEMGNYVVAQTTDTDEDGMVKTPGNINGGFYAKTDNPGSHPPSVVISVDDIQDAIEEVKKAGGKILGGMNEKGEHIMEPQMIPGVGLWISIEDTEGNRVSMLQANPRQANA
jgi:predicted enzyme related to lactoylglutathione lyase